MAEGNFFESIEYLEPKCPNCGTKIDWGMSTNYQDKYESHVCNTCNHVFK